MKNGLPVLLVFILSACTTTLNLIPTETSYFGIDFRKYTSEGFLITPEKYLGEYESIGVVKYVIVPGAEYKVLNKVTYSDGTTQSIQKWVVNQITLSQGLDSLYHLSKAMGADAIVNFSSNTTQRNYQSIANPVTLEGYELSGFAIKRKN
jgi:hypothetical protein